jgi:putative membrane protein
MLRWLFPSDLNEVGSDPDYRFSLANERTFLAWIRTSLALTAGGIGAVILLDDVDGATALGLFVLGLALVTAVLAPVRWARNERAMRLNEPLPVSWVPQAVALSTAGIALAATILLVLR